MLKFLFILPLILLTISCGGGLDPEDAEANNVSFLNGKIYFKSQWPDSSEVFGIRVAAFKDNPPYDSDSLIADIVNEDAYFTFASLPLFLDSVEFSIEIKDPPVTLKYITAAQQYDSTILDQRAVGIYTVSGNKNEPSELFIDKGSIYDITIDVDFNDLPPQPFK